MNKNVIKELIRRILSEREEVFLKEQDIQLYLAIELINTNMFDNVFIEYRVPIDLINGYLWGNRHKVDVDILLELNGEFFPIELKYKTVLTAIERNLFGEDIQIELANQGAQNENCYFVWKDVKRNEILSSNFHNVITGITILITNDDSYLVGPSENSQYYPFCFSQNKRVNSVEWNGASESKLQKCPNFELENEYVVNWEELENMNGNFKLLLL